ncbi:hypothetical protein [Bombilactobacillus apium]|nr:hypothetical protein [Bombilactobacillus apium]
MIKLPAGVPAAVSNSFVALLPGILVYTFLVSLLWVCGIHGDMAL